MGQLQTQCSRKKPPPKSGYFHVPHATTVSEKYPQVKILHTSLPQGVHWFLTASLPSSAFFSEGLFPPLSAVRVSSPSFPKILGFLGWESLAQEQNPSLQIFLNRCHSYVLNNAQECLSRLAGGAFGTATPGN